IIAFLDALARVPARLGHARPFVRGLGRTALFRTHVSPQDCAALDARIALETDLAAEGACGRLRRDVDALAGHVVFPAVIGASDAMVLVAPEPQAHAAMCAELVDQARATVAVTKGDE